jgi:adenosylcobinamide kinase/adenosylcobinamide-phosphate guanylyltransferase
MEMNFLEHASTTKNRTMIYYITGGERSGKTRYAQELALELTDRPVYIATSRIWDEHFHARVQRHKEERDERWTTIEEEKSLSRIDLKNKVAVMDCVTLWLTNFFTDTHSDVQTSFTLAKVEFDRFLSSPTRLEWVCMRQPKWAENSLNFKDG